MQMSDAGTPGPLAALDALTFGETMAMLIAEELGPLAGVERFIKRVAGADSNVAIGLARLGLKVGWVSRLGADSFGEFVQQALQREGVDTSHVAIDAQRSTGFMLKGRAEGGADPKVEYYRRGSAASQLSTGDFDAAYFLGARHLHATGITPALSAGAAELTEHAMRSMRAAGRSVSFDPNLRPRLWPSEAAMREHLNRLAGLADWVLPGLAEGRLLTGHDEPRAIAGFYLERGASAVVLKLGPAGAYVRTVDQEVTVPGVHVAHVVDTVGAGDGFAAGVISGRLDGLDWAGTLQRANWIGAQVVQAIGDVDGLPRRAQLPG
jgi:sugar/nucleoside kinase (ribokinase family)